MPLRILALVAILACGLFFTATPAQAQSCNYALDDANFGSVTPIDNQEFYTQTTFHVTGCTGTANQTIKICLSLGGGSGSPTLPTPRLLVSGSNELSYDIYSDPSRTARWGSLSAGGSGIPPALFIPLDASGQQSGGEQTQKLYFKILSGQQAAAYGQYFSDFAPNHTGINADYTSGVCTSAGFIRADFNVSASIDETCDVLADAMDFGERGVLDANVEATANLSVDCTADTDYTVSLGNGQNGTSSTTRKMANGSATIAYDLYSDTDRSIVFGSAVGETVGGIGTGSSQTIPVYGRVPPQDTPPAGTYDDVVVVTVTY